MNIEIDDEVDMNVFEDDDDDPYAEAAGSASAWRKH